MQKPKALDRETERAREIRMDWLASYDVELTRYSSMGLDDRIAQALRTARAEGYAAGLEDAAKEITSLAMDRRDFARTATFPDRYESQAEILEEEALSAIRALANGER